MTDQMYRIALASRPEGAPGPDNFSYESAPIPTPGEGEVLVRSGDQVEAGLELVRLEDEA